MKRLPWLVPCSLLLALCTLVGCSDTSKPAPASISGTVSLDGKPLPEGTITLTDAAGGTPDTMSVKDGSFQGQAAPGKKRVEIRAYKQGKETKMGDTVIEAPQENYLPARFNSESTLTADVSASGINPSKFEVQSK